MTKTRTITAVEVAPTNGYLRNKGIGYIVFETMTVGGFSMVNRAYSRDLESARRDFEKGADSFRIIGHADPEALNYRTN